MFCYIIFQLVRYPHEDPAIKNMQIIIAVGMAAFSVIDIMLLGLGALLVTITLVSFSFKKYYIENSSYKNISKFGLAKYAAAIAFIEIVSWYT
ncbi:MAG: hypothetical protein AMJ53_17505 [Gammaproteobacteria bacterium SG8_11]|nr:MAG: hypothetical protein AMJ53_17505 [Gammaproteobacteria bacterium SG8_11]